jgi:hypothetical protein
MKMEARKHIKWHTTASLRRCVMPDYNKHTRNEALQRLKELGSMMGAAFEQVKFRTNPFDKGKSEGNRDHTSTNIVILLAL